MTRAWTACLAALALALPARGEEGQAIRIGPAVATGDAGPELAGTVAAWLAEELRGSGRVRLEEGEPTPELSITVHVHGWLSRWCSVTADLFRGPGGSREKTFRIEKAPREGLREPVRALARSLERYLTGDPALEAGLATAGLRVLSDPEGASVFLDGRDTGKETPCTIEGLVPRHYVVTVRLEGRGESSRLVEAQAGGEPAEASFVLLPWWQRDPTTALAALAVLLFAILVAIQVRRWWVKRDRSGGGERPPPPS